MLVFVYKHIRVAVNSNLIRGNVIIKGNIDVRSLLVRQVLL